MSNSQYQVFARRFRPAKFDEVVAQSHVCSTLMNAVTAERIAQAYLFSGPRGVGKTSVARIFAKSLNCVEGPTLEPCGKCVSCVAISTGDDTDVIEIDGASNRGIDEIRDLREKVRFAPGHGRYKVYIIDEVHMLTDQAFNALLKTLEEPPRHVIFIFATTRPEKVPDTIVSRCQRYPFQRIPTSLILDKLTEIAKVENVDAEPEALSLLARRAAGSLRDGESLFDQVIAFSSGRITVHDVERSLGLVGGEAVERLVTAVLEGKGADALKAIDLLSDEGSDLVQAAHQAVAYLRNLMVLNTAPDAEELVDLSSEETHKMREIALSLPGSTILTIMDIFLEATGWISRVLSPRLVLEYAALKGAKARQVLPLEDFIEALRNPQTADIFKKQTVPDVPLRKKTETDGTPDTAPLLGSTGAPEEKKEETPVREETHREKPRVSGASAAELWEALLVELEKNDKSKHAKMINGRVVDLNGSLLTIGFPYKYEFIAKMLNDVRREEEVNEILHKLTGKPIKCKFVVEEGREPGDKKNGQTDGPEVKVARDLFGGDIIDVRDVEE